MLFELQVLSKMFQLVSYGASSVSVETLMDFLLELTFNRYLSDLP